MAKGWQFLELCARSTATLNVCFSMLCRLHLCRQASVNMLRTGCGYRRKHLETVLELIGNPFALRSFFLFNPFHIFDSLLCDSSTSHSILTVLEDDEYFGPWQHVLDEVCPRKTPCAPV